MQIKKTKVTPQKAAEWLEKNFDRNRKIRKSHVAKLVFDMKNDNWKDTGECIKFNTMGHLVDGQHRLTAIVESGCTVELWVATDLPNDAINAIDTGASRSAGDVMAIHGGRYPKHTPSLVRKIFAWEKGTGGKDMRWSRGVSVQRIIEYCEKHPEIYGHVEASMKLYARSVNASILTQGEWAFLHWLFSQTDRADADAFLTSLSMLDAPSQSPIRTLFMRLNNGVVKLPTKTKVNYAIRAWNAWRNKEKDVVLKIRIADGEPVPDLV